MGAGGIVFSGSPPGAAPRVGDAVNVIIPTELGYRMVAIVANTALFLGQLASST